MPTTLKPQSEFPEHGIFGLSLNHTAPDANVYLGQNRIGDDLLISEIFNQKFCTRSFKAGVDAKRNFGDQWAALLSEKRNKITLLSRISHPSLFGILQRFEADKTSYFVTDFEIGNAASGPGSATLAPKDLEQHAIQLIDLLENFHAHDIIGINIVSDALIHNSEDNTLKLSLRHYIDGSFEIDPSGSKSLDCLALAKTFHKLLTGTAPKKPYTKLAGRNLGVSAAFITSLDEIISNDKNTPIASARDWKKSILGTPAKIRKRRAKTKRSNLPIFIGLSAILLCTAVFGIWKYWSPSKPAQTIDTNLTKFDKQTVRWQMVLPIEILPVTKSGQTEYQIQVTEGRLGNKDDNPWLQDGAIVKAVNGEPIDETTNLHKIALTSLITKGGLDPITLTLKDPNLPLSHDVSVSPIAWRDKNYGPITLRQQTIPTGSLLSVQKIEAGQRFGVQVGDILIRDEETLLEFTDFASFEASLNRVEPAKNSNLAVLVKRTDDNQRVVGFNVEPFFK